MTIRKSFNQILLPLAFHHEGETWNRRVGGVIEVVDVQRDRVTSTVAVSVGVCDLELHSKLWRAPAISFARDTDCAVRRRLVRSIDGGDWWPMAPIPYEDIAASLSEDGLCFLERMRNRDEQIKWLAAPQMLRRAGPQELICLAYAYQSLGRTAEACELLRKHGRRVVGAWSERVAEVLDELKCC
jgi:hypothetical protein